MQGRERSLRWKISFLLSAVVLVVMTLLSTGDYFWQRRAFLQNLNAHIAEEAHLVAFLVNRTRTPQEIQRLLQELHTTPEPSHPHIVVGEVMVFAEDGTIIASDVPAMLGQRFWHQGLDAVLRDNAPQHFGLIERDGNLFYYGLIPLTLPTGERLAIQVTEPYAPILAQMRAFLGQRLLFMALVTLALILATLATTHYIVLTPLERLARTIEQVSQGDLNTRVQIRRRDELGAIGQAFNRMVEALKDAQRRGEEERERLTLLYQINRRLASVSDWEALVELIIHLPKEFLPAAGAIFLSYNEHTRRFHMEGAWGISDTAAAVLEQRLLSLENPACLSCPPRMAHAEQNCPLLVPGLLCSPCDRMVCIHLAQGTRTVGFLYVLIPEDAALPPEKVQLLNAVSGEIAAAVAVAQARARELALLSNMEKAQPTPATIQDTLQRILTWTLEASQSNRGAIFLYEEETHHLYPVVWRDIPPEDMDKWRDLARQGLHHESPLVLSRRDVFEADVEHIAVIPLRLGDRPLGSLIFATERENTYTRHHMTFLSAIASQTALMVQTARLYERLEQQAILEERTRLAREIHDGLAQSLAFIRMKLYQLQQWLEQGQQNRVDEALRLIKQVVEEAYLDAREAIEGLRLPVNDRRTFNQALEDYTQRFTARTGIPVDLNLDDLQLPPNVQVQLLRVVQEALTNARKHARATHIWVRLEQEMDTVRFTIEDNGVGFDPHMTRDHRRFGLQIMAERVESLGGHIHIWSKRGQGTRIEVVLPVSHASIGEVRDEENSRAGRG